MTKRDSSDMRIDKFLWAVRLFKTRSLATESCKKGRIMINNIPVKPSHPALPGESFILKKAPASLTYRIIDLPHSRLPAKLVPDFLQDLTPVEEKEKLDVRLTPAQGVRERGAGRPTKKERREMDRYKDDL